MKGRVLLAFFFVADYALDGGHRMAIEATSIELVPVTEIIIITWILHFNLHFFGVFLPDFLVRVTTRKTYETVIVK